MSEIKYNFLQISKNPKNWQSDIFVRGRHLNSVMDEIIQSVQKKLNCSERSLCKKLRISRTVIRKIRRKSETHSIRITLIKGFLKRAPSKQKEEFIDEINSSIEEVSTYQSSNWIKIPKALTERLAEMLGRHAGDGCIRKANYTMSVISGDKKYTDFCIKDFKDIFGIEPKIYRDGHCSEIKINSLPLSMIFNKFYGMPIGKKSDIIREPQIVKKDKKLRAAFLRGIIDTDGSVFLNKQNKPVLEIYSNSKHLLKNCKNIIYLFGYGSKIRTKVASKKNSYILRVSVRDTPRILNIVKPKIKNMPSRP